MTERTVTAIVKSKAEVEDGFKFELDIPEFKSQYPTIVNRIPAELAAQFKAGQTYQVVLEQQKLKANKEGKYPTDYFWGLKGISDKPATIQPQPQNSDTTRQSIERQVALKAATELAGYCIAAGLAPQDAETWVGPIGLWANRLYQMLVGYPVEMTPEAPKRAAKPPVAPKLSQEPEGDAQGFIDDTFMRERPHLDADLTTTQFSAECRRLMPGIDDNAIADKVFEHLGSTLGNWVAHSTLRAALRRIKDKLGVE